MGKQTNVGTYIFGTAIFWGIAIFLANLFGLFINGYLQIHVLILVGFFFLIGMYSFICLLKETFNLESTKEKTDTNLKSNKWKVVGTIVIMIGLWGGFVIACKKPELTKSSQLVNVNGTFEKLEYSKSTKGSASMTFKIKELPEVIFELAHPRFLNLNTTIEDDLTNGESVYFEIDKKDYNSYFLKTQEFTFSQKYFGHNSISVYSISSKNGAYLSIEEYNALNNDDPVFVIIFIIFISIYGIVLLKKIWKNEIYYYLSERGHHDFVKYLSVFDKKAKGGNNIN